MKKVLMLLAAVSLLSWSVSPCSAKESKDLAKTYSQWLPKYEYKLKDAIEVKGRQGIASDGEFYYVSNSKALYKYDKTGKLIASNENPFEGYAIPSNHIGDIDVFNGEIFVSAENFMDGVGKDQTGILVLGATNVVDKGNGR